MRDPAARRRCTVVRAYCREELAIDSGAEPDEVTERELRSELARDLRAAALIPGRAMWRADRSGIGDAPVLSDPSRILGSLRHRPRAGFPNDSSDPSRSRTCGLRFRKAPL